MKTKIEIVQDWLPRYTGTPLENFNKYILFTNFTNYLKLFVSGYEVKIFGIGKPMQTISAYKITIINFGMGSGMTIDMETTTLFTVGFINIILIGASLFVSDNPMVPAGIKTRESDKKITDQYLEMHLQIGIDALKELINSGDSVKHIRF